MLIPVVPIRLCWFSEDPSRDSFDVLSDARSKRIRKHSRMRRNLLLISCNLTLLDLERGREGERGPSMFNEMKKCLLSLNLDVCTAGLFYTGCSSD